MRMPGVFLVRIGFVSRNTILRYELLFQRNADARSLRKGERGRGCHGPASKMPSGLVDNCSWNRLGLVSFVFLVASCAGLGVGSLRRIRRLVKTDVGSVDPSD